MSAEKGSTTCSPINLRPGTVAVARTASVARPIAYLMGLSGLTYLVQGWVVGSGGCSGTHTALILVAWALSLAWMIWLVVVAWRVQDSRARRLADEGASPATTSPTITPPDRRLPRRRRKCRRCQHAGRELLDAIG